MEIADSQGVPLPLTFDLEVFFEVGATLRPGNNLLVDLQWLVDSLFQINVIEFFRQLDESGAFQPSAIEASGNQTSNSNKKTLDTGFFDTWVVASLGAVVFSVFLTGLLMTRVVQRTREREFSTSSSSNESHEQSVSRSKMVRESPVPRVLMILFLPPTLTRITSSLCPNEKIDRIFWWHGRRVLGWSKFGTLDVVLESRCIDSWFGDWS
jgi:hypothetical protein